MPSQRIGERFKALLHEKNHTIVSASESTGVSESTLGRIANNRCGVTPTIMHLLCKGLDCTPADILGNDPETPVPTDNASYATDVLRLSYEERVLDMTESHIAEIKRLEASHQQHIKDLKLSRNIWAALSFSLMALLIIWFIWDITHPHYGLIQYDSMGRIIIGRLQG